MNERRYLVVMTNSEDIYIGLTEEKNIPKDGMNDENAWESINEDETFQTFTELFQHLRDNSIVLIGEYQGIAY